MGTTNQRTCIITVVVVIVIIATVTISLVVHSLKKLASDEVGIQYNTLERTLGEEPFLEGLHLGPPGYKFIIFPNTFSTMSFSNLRCLNRDGVEIRLNVAYQYKAHPKAIRNLVLDFKDFDNYKKVLNYVGRSSLHDACSHFNTTQFQTERGTFQEMIRSLLQKRYKDLNCTVTDLQVNNIARPSAYESAIRSKERAREDIIVADNEQPRLLTEAKTVKRQAETQGQIIMDKAESEARIRNNRADLEAQAIQLQYQKEADAYSFIMSNEGLGFTKEGFISYLGARVVASAENPVFISLDTPAKTSYVTKP